MIYYLIFIYYILWLQNSNLILKSDLTALVCFSDAKFSLIIYMVHIMSVKYFLGTGWLIGICFFRKMMKCSFLK